MINERTWTIWRGIRAGVAFFLRRTSGRRVRFWLLSAEAAMRIAIFRLFLICFSISLELLEKTAFPFASRGSLQYLWGVTHHRWACRFHDCLFL
jgi:hypothetical protein